MGVFVFLPLVPPLTAWPVARLAEHHLHPRDTTWLLSAVAAVLALCSTWCLGLLMVVGTAQLPGNPLPDGWSDPEVRAAVPYDEVAGRIASPALVAVLLACTGNGLAASSGAPSGRAGPVRAARFARSRAARPRTVHVCPAREARPDRRHHRHAGRTERG